MAKTSATPKRPKSPEPGTAFILPELPPPPSNIQHTAHGTAKIHKPKEK